MSAERIKLLEIALIAYVERYGLTPAARHALCAASPAPALKATDMAQSREADFFFGNETGAASLAAEVTCFGYQYDTTTTMDHTTSDQ